MNKITMIGTGHGLTLDLYNTCFVINDKFLIDTGGAGLIKNLRLSGIELPSVHNVFISHSHTDHILGLFWLIKAINGLYRKGIYVGRLNVYCNDEVSPAINDVYRHLFSRATVELISEYLNVVVVDDGDEVVIENQKYKFFDTRSGRNKMFGFETTFDNGKQLVFLGDEMIDEGMYEIVRGKDYVMHEALCLDADKEAFWRRGKSHPTVKEVCEKLNGLGIKNLILFHTEDSHPDNKNVLYENEAKSYFKNNVIVPKDLDVILV